MHMPVIPREEFKGKTGQGDWADSLLELDTDFGTLLDLLDELDVADNTLVVFAGDNGPEEVLLVARHARLLGGLLLRRRRRQPAHPVHRALARARTGRAGQRRDHAHHRLVHHDSARRRAERADRPGDRRRQPARLAQRAASRSRRDGYIYWMGPEMYGVKWRNFKLALVVQKYSTDPVGKLSSPRIINLITDPQEREPLNLPYLHSWTVAHFNRILANFRASVQHEPLVPAAAPIDFVPRVAA